MAQLADDRFAALLAPIRDLAATWNVDVAHELEEYLEELESITFQFEAGPTLNFAEAALLIQGSTGIYSKKVEYLHSLVYQALEFLKHDGRGMEGQPGAGAGADDDVDEFFDKTEQFLSLDDLLEEGTGIDLDEGAEHRVATVVRPPGVLLALDDGAGGAGEGDAGASRLALCSVHCSGALLLEPRDGDLLDERLQPVGSTVGGWGAWPADGRATDAGAGPSGMVVDSAHGADDLGPGMASDGDDDHYDRGGFGGEDDYGGWQDGSCAASSGEAVGGTAAQGAVVRSGPQQRDEFFDPYKPLDPNSAASRLPTKPFKKLARVARRPRARTAQRGAVAVAAAACGDALLTLVPPVGGMLLPEFAPALRALLTEEAGGRPAKQTSSRATSQRSAQTRLASAFTFEEAAGDEDEEAGDALAMDDYFGGGGMATDDDDYGPVAPEFAAPDWNAAPSAAEAQWLEDAASHDTGEAGRAAIVCAGRRLHSGGDAAGLMELSYEELCRTHIEAFISAAAAAEVQTDLAARVAGWRSKVQPVLEEEDARPEFDIHQVGEAILARMDDLSAATGAPPAAGGDDGGSTEPPPLRFGQVVSGVGSSASSADPGGQAGLPAEQRYLVSRTFSSLLQLVNNGNVRVTKLGSGNGQFELLLLQRELPHARRLDQLALRQAGASEPTSKAAADAEDLRGHDDPGLEEEENRGGHQPARGGSGSGSKATKGKAAAEAGGRAGGKAAKRRKAGAASGAPT
eukprot:scaffold18.g1915.t1